MINNDTQKQVFSANPAKHCDVWSRIVDVLLFQVRVNSLQSEITNVQISAV